MSKELSGAEATKLMKAMDEDEKIEQIYRSPNVIGFERFCAVAQQVALRESYRKPKGEDN